MNKKKKDKKSKLSNDEEDNDVFSAERLLKKRVVRNQIQYLVKWLNWSEQYNSWEPKANILDSRLITEFERNQSNKKTTSGIKNRGKSSRSKLLKIIKENAKKEDDKIDESDEEIIENEDKDQNETDINLKNESTSAIKLNEEPTSSKSIRNNTSNVEENKTSESEYESANQEPSDNNNLVISASELVKIKNARFNRNIKQLNRQPSSTITTNSIQVNEQLTDNSNDDNQIDESDQSEIEINRNQNLNNNQKDQYSPNNNNQTEEILNSPSSSSKNFNPINQVYTQKQIRNEELNPKISINLINPINRNFNNSNLSGNNNNYNNSSNQINQINYSHNYNQNHNHNHNHNLVNIVNPIIHNSNQNRIINPFIINQQQQTNLIQNVNSFNSLMNRSDRIIQNEINIVDDNEIIEINDQIDQFNEQILNQTSNEINEQLNNNNNQNESKINSFQETSEAILNSTNSKRFIKRHLPPNLFWKHNVLANQILITDVMNNDKVGITIRESFNGNFFAKSTKKKKLKNKINLKKFDC